MVDNNQHQEKPQDFELIELLFGKVDSSTSNAVDQLDQSFEARYQSLVDQIQSYLHSSEKPGFFPHRFLGSFSSVLDTKLNDKLGIKKLHFRFEGARTLKVVAETESKTHVFIFTEDIEAQHSKQTNTKNFEFTTGEWKNVMGRDYTPLDERKLQIDVIKILKDKYELVKSRPKSDKDVKSKKLHLYLKNNVLEYKAKDVYGNIQTMQIDSSELKGNNAFKNKFFDEIKQFLDKSGKDLSDDVRKELSRLTSAKGYTLKRDGEDEKINIKVESKKKIVDQPIEPTVKFQEVTKKLDKSVYLESYIEKLVSSDTRQAKENLEKILTYIKEVHTNLNLQGNVYGIKAREADQHGFVAGIFDNFRYRDNTKLYLEQFAGGGYADIVLLVRGPNRAVDSVPILIELKAGTEGQIAPSDALKQAEDYVKGFRPNKMRVLTNAGNVIAVGLNLDSKEPFKTEVKPIKQPSSLMEDFIKLALRWNNQQLSEKDFKQEIADLLSSEYHTFPANKETKDHYYFSRYILGESILIDGVGQDKNNIKKYIYSYGEYPLDWSGGTEYTLSKSPVMTLIFVQGNEGQEKTAFIFHIRESNTKEFYADKKIPVLNIPEIGGVGNVIEIKMSLKKYETGLSFEELFEIEQISKYKPSGADQPFTGNFLKIPNSDELKVKFDQAITSQHATSSDGEVSLQAYKVLLSEVADAVYPIKDLITNEARLQAVLNGLLSSYSDLKLKETATKQEDSAKTVIIPEFQVGAGGRVDMVIQGIGPSPQGAKEYTPVALEFKLIDKNLDEEGMKKEVDKLTKEQNIRYAKGAALKAITDSDKMLFMGVVVNVKAKDKNSLIIMSDKFVPALVVHSSIDIAKRKHLEEIQEVTQRLKNIGIQEENLRTLESAIAEKDYHYWLQQHDIADIARIEYGYGADTLFEIVGSPEHIVNQLQQFQDSVTTRGERRPLTLIINLDNNHWVTLVISHQNGQYNGYYADSLGSNAPGNIRQVLQQAQITINDISVTQQIDGHNCGLWALENARDINAVLQGDRSNIPDEIRNRLQGQGRDENYFIRMREGVSEALSIDPQRIANLDEAILAETQAPKKKFDLNSCIGQGNRRKRSINPCLFSKGDVEKFSKGKVDENNVDKIEIDSEKFLTYIKSSKDEGKNAQLIEFVGDKSIEGDHKYLLDKVIEDQGYERYIQNERIKDLHGDIVHQDSSLTKNPKLKSRLMNAAGGIQLIRGIHGAIVSCKDGTATDCGLNLGGMAWSFASQPIENVMVKITPKVVVSAEKVVGKIIPGTLGKQTKFVVRVTGVKFGSTIAKGTAGALTGVFDIVDIGMSASNLVDCKKRENSDNPCGEKEIRDNIASISFSGVSFVSGVALTAASMPVVGIAVGFGLMVGYGIYSGVSNIVEYKKKYDTTHGENWSIFWRTLLFQPMAADVQHLAARKDTVNSLAKQVWKALNNGPNSTVAYGIGLGKVSGNTLRPDYAKIIMDKEHADTRSISRVIPDLIKNAKTICLPRITNADYEKGLKKSVPAAVHYCDNAMVIADGRKSMQNGKTIVYDLRNVNSGNIIGSNVLDNSFLIFGGSEKIIGGDNTVNRFVLTNSGFAGQIIVGTNSTNVFDLSQIADDVVKVNIVHSIGSTISKTLHSGVLEIKMNDRSLINECVTNDVNILGYHYIGRQNKTDEVSCTSSTGDFIDYDTIIDSKGGYNNDKRDIIKNCDRAIILPYTNAKGVEGNYTFYVRNAEYTGTNLHSEIDVKGTGTVIFPETDLLNDCDEITYSSNNNTLSLKIGLGQNNRYTLDIKNYIKQSTSKPNFILIDKNGSNIVPKIKELGATKINSFELHSEYALDNFDDVENHYKKILNNNKDYKVFSVIRGKTQSQDNNAVPHMVFGSLEDDIVNFDQGTTFARGGEGNDVYLISGDINSREVKIDNNSDDRKLDAISMPEIPEEFRVQECDLYLDYNNTNIQVKNYLKDNRYRHLTVMNSKGETFIPYVQSMSCVSSSIENGKLVPFFHATQTQNMFVLPKDFQDDHVVIDSRLEDIERYRNKDHLLLIRNNEVPFIIKVEDFYYNQSKWRDVNFLLWNDGNFSPYLGLQQEVNGIMYYQDKLKSDYEKTVKEYTIDFNESVDITHNQNGTLNSVEEDEKHIGVMILKDITPDRIKVSSSNTDLVFSDEVSNHTINIKNWNNSESYRISMLGFDLGLEPIIIRKLDGFSLSEVKKIQDLIEKASDNYQKRTKYAPNIEKDFKCLVSVNGFKSENKTYECLGFSSLQDQINFTENFCSAEQIEEFKGKIPNNDQVLLLLKKLQNDLSLNGYDQNVIDQCDRLMITSGLGILKLLINNAAQKGEWERVKDLLDTTANRSNADIENKKGWSSTWTLLHYAVYNGNLDLLKDTYQLLLSKVIDVNAKDKYGWTPLYYAIYYNQPDIVKFFIDRGADIDIKDNNGKTPLEVANEYGKPKIISILINKVIENGQFDVVKNFLKKTAKEVKIEDKNEWETSWELLHYAAYNGRVDVLRGLFDLLLEKSGGDINVQESKYNWTPLHYAVYYGRSEMVEFLIDKGADTEIKDKAYGEMPLHKAAYYGALDIVKLLVEKGANMNAKNKRGETSLDVALRSRKNSKVRQFLDENNGLSPLHYAAKEGNLDLLKVLLNKGDNINAKDKYGWTPLHYAVEHNRFDVMRLLINSNAISIEAKDRNGKTPLHVAARQGCITSINLLLDKGANVTAETNNSDWNWTPLHYAVYYNKPDAVKYLMSRGANVKVGDKKGNTPAYYAVGGHRAYDRKKRSTSDSNQQSYAAQSQEDRLEVLELLISKADIETKNDDDQTLFHIAAQGRRLRAVRLLVNKIESINFEDSLYEEPNELIRAVRQRERLKSLINEKDKFGYTPLQYAAKNGNWGMVNLFLDKTAEGNPDDVANKDQFSISWTTVHYTVYNGDLNLLNDIFQFLSDKETIINTKDNSGWTPLHYAVYYNASDMVKFLVNEGADISVKDKDDKTPLGIARGKGHTDIVQYLAERSRDYARGKKAMHFAAENNNVEALSFLVSKGENVNDCGYDYWRPLHYAAKAGSLEAAEFLVENGAGFYSKKYETTDGQAPIHIAAYYGHKNIVKFFVVEKRVDVNWQDGYVYFTSLLGNYLTPLHWASKGGRLDVVEYLVSLGANIDAKDKNGKTPINIARGEGHTDIVQYLEERSKDYARGKKAMHFAAENNNVEALSFLVSKGENVNDCGYDYWRPLHYAAKAGSLEAAEFLVENGAGFYSKKYETTDGQAPIHIAAYYGHKNIVKFFVVEKRVDVNWQDGYVYFTSLLGNYLTPLHWASKGGRLDVVEYLVSLGANIDAKDKNGKTPINIARGEGHTDIVQYLEERSKDYAHGKKAMHFAAENNDMETLRFLVGKGENVNDCGDDYWRPLHYAAKAGSLEAAKFLVENGAGFYSKKYETTDGQAPIHIAAYYGHKNIVKFFVVEKGVDVNWQDGYTSGFHTYGNYSTPLHWASKGGRLDVVEYLVSLGANIDAKDWYSKTPIDIARDNGHNNVINYLEKELNQERGSPAQRKRRYHHGDHSRHHNHLSRKPLAIDSSNQPKIAASSGTRPSSWINGLFGWVKGSVGGLFYSRAALSEEASNTASSIPQVDEQFVKASVSSSSSTSTTLPSDGTDKKQENGGFFRDNIDYVNANIKQIRERQTPVKFKPSGGNTILEMGDHYLSHVDFNGTIMLLDLLIRKVTGQKYISTVDQSISPLEAQGYALNITKEFEKVVEQAAKDSKISMHRLNIDFVKIQKEVTGKIMGGKFNEILGILNSYVEKVCPGREAGKLSPKKFDKFITEFNNKLDVALNQSMQQISHSRNSTLEVSEVKEQQISLEPRSYLNNTSVQGYLAQGRDLRLG